MTSTIVYNGALRTTMTHLESGTQVSTDAPKDNHGLGEAFSPTDFVASALGACALSIMAITARNYEGLDIEGARAEVNKVMGANPRRIAKIELTIYMPERTYTEKEKQVLENAAHACPVARSLHPDLEQVLTFVWHS